VLELTRETKTEKLLLLGSHGKYLGIKGWDFIIRNKKRSTVKKVLKYSVSDVILQTGNTVSVGALAVMMFWEMNVMIMTASGKPIGTMMALEDSSHVKTRMCQYEAYRTGKGVNVAKQLVLGKIEAQTQLLRKRGLEPFRVSPKKKIDLLKAKDVDGIRNRLTAIEGKFTRHYFKQIFPLFPKFLRIKKRVGYRAFDATNNLFNMAYEVLRWKMFRSLIGSKLEPYLGFLHSMSHNHPALVSDLMELYRCIIDDFLIDYSRELKKRDFEKHYEKGRYKKKALRIYLDHPNTRDLINRLNRIFESEVDVPRRQRGKRQRLESLFNEEASLLAGYLRGEKSKWIPRVVIL
jgi:CRISPR-associated endonuclease Cas1